MAKRIANKGYALANASDWLPANVVIPPLPEPIQRLLSTPLVCSAVRLASGSPPASAIHRTADSEAEGVATAHARTPRTPITGFVSYRDVMAAVGCSKSAAYRHLREAVGRPNGTGTSLRASVEVWERYAKRTFGR